jgi:transcriptional regulator with XRE-family HTH domain
VPKKSGKINEREREICERVRKFREAAKWNQSDFASELGITLNQLASIEYSRTPLRYEMAIFLCKRFDISQRWLAKGILPIHPRYEIKEEHSILAKPKTLFSQVFDSFLDASTNSIEKAIVKMIGEENFRSGNFDDAVFANFPPAALASAQAATFYVRKLINLRLNSLPENLLLIYNNFLLQANELFLSKHKKDLSRLTSPQAPEFVKSSAVPKKFNQAMLDNLIKSNNDVLVKSKVLPLLEKDIIRSLPKLIDSIRARVGGRGQKIALARELKVSRQAVDQWLSGDAKPSSEMTFKLLNWVEQQEHPK